MTLTFQVLSLIRLSSSPSAEISLLISKCHIKKKVFYATGIFSGSLRFEPTQLCWCKLGIILLRSEELQLCNPSETGDSSLKV